MPVEWPFAEQIIELRGVGERKISAEDAARQTQTAKSILADLRERPGVVLADEVGLGKTYVAMAVAASVIMATRASDGPVVVMTPPALRAKWQRDWHQFKSHCVRNHALDHVRDEYAHTPTEFFKLLDDPPEERARLIFVTTGCFYRALQDPWVKLAMIRLARSRTRLSEAQKRRVYRWAPDLVRQVSNRKLSDDVIRRLLRTDVLEWKPILVAEGILDEHSDDPVPDRLPKCADEINWTPLCEVFRELPAWRREFVSEKRRNEIRTKFTEACRSPYKDWLRLVHWRSPLLILDEAHHAKNDTTRLARLFRETTEEERALLEGKFDRMLFLTATPFQLGHHELIAVLRSFKAVRWSSGEAPAGKCEDFEAKMDELEKALDEHRLASRRFDRLWGKLRAEMIRDRLREDGGKPEGDLRPECVLEWWRRVESAPANHWEQELAQAFRECEKTKQKAEELLRPWVIRHNRSATLPGTEGVPRRNVLVGEAIRTAEAESGTSPAAAKGLPIEERALLPFLITARVQGQLAHWPGTRAYFAEGLASSYEAFHHTRDDRRKAKDSHDGLDVDAAGKPWAVPMRWYEDQIARLIPSRRAPRSERLAHPKVSATVERTVELWRKGEKVLVFCFYVQTARALREHLRQEIDHQIIRMAGEKLGLDPQRDGETIEAWLKRIARRLTDAESPFYREMRSLLTRELDRPQYKVLRPYRGRLGKVLMAYFRSPSFIARYLPLEDRLVREALGLRRPRREVIERGMEALRRAVLEAEDASGQTYLDRVAQFLDFAVELAERAARRLVLRVDETSDEAEDPLLEYLDAVGIYCRPRRPEQEDEDEVEEARREGSYRVRPLVRLVHGGTRPEVRDRLMHAFNSPLFPEILVTSSVMGEGVDLHRFCRHVIHHDLSWNPSTLEQRAGRLDRIRCKAEVCRRPIQVYEPFLAGGADEKMFRVVRDRERWFQIVMGQKFELDEATSEDLASRVPLPDELAARLSFRLSRWSPGA